MNTQCMFNQAFAFSASNRPWHWMHSGGEAVQIGCPADLSGIPDRNDVLFGLAEKTC